jgi:putative ABC transport system substrate-binding protein
MVLGSSKSGSPRTTAQLDLRTPDDIPFAFETAKRQRTDAIVVSMDTVTQANAKLITQLAAERRLPAIYGGREFIDAGGLMSYGVNFPDHTRACARTRHGVLLRRNCSHRLR